MFGFCFCFKALLLRMALCGVKTSHICAYQLFSFLMFYVSSLSLTCAMLFRREVLLDDWAELRAEVVAVEPSLEQRTRRAVLDKVSE